MLLVVVSTQPKPQTVWPVGQLQVPLTQLSPKGHTFPQDPQLRAFVSVFTQALPQRVWPAAQPVVHAPDTHCCVCVQRVPHAPQCVGSVCKFTHCPLQLVVPPPHWHCPATQFSPVGQAVPQAPQANGSVCRFTQLLVQLVSPAAQVALQTPREHTGLPPSAVQALPHEPQFETSPCVSVQTPLHRCPLL